MMLTNLTQDLNYALRGLRQNPLFATIAVLSLAVGIGANTAIFTLLDRLLIRPLPLPDPHELVQLELPGPRSGQTITNRAFSYPMYRELCDRNQTTDGLAAQISLRGSFSTGQRSEVINVHLVSGNWFGTLGVGMRLGRPIAPSDDVTPDAHPVIVLSHGFWKRRFGADPGIVNQTAVLNGQRMTILGVVQEEFRGTDITSPPDVYLPLQMTRLMAPNAFGGMKSSRFFYLHLFARRKNDVSLATLRADLDRVVAPILDEEAKALQFRTDSTRQSFIGKRFTLHPAATGNLSERQQIQTAMMLLSALVAGVLLIACANVANLLLARATSRRREIAVRLALGASRWQLIRLVLTESVLLAILGGALGLLVAHWAVDGVLLYANPSGAQAFPIDGAPDGRIMIFTAAISLLTGVLFGLAPALAASKPNVAPALKDESGSLAGGSATAWLRKGLVVVQVALSLLLLAAASLFLTSLHNLRHVNAGFDTTQLITFTVDPAMNGYKREQASALADRLSEEIAALPLVRGVTMASEPLMADSLSQRTVKIEGYQAAPEEDMNPVANEVGPGFFETMRIPLLRGRDFEQADVSGAPLVAIVSETFANMYFKDRDPLGYKLGFGNHPVPVLTIVGVVGDIKQLGPRDDRFKRHVYIPVSQAASINGLTYYVRTNATMQAMSGSVRAILKKLDPNMAIDQFRTMDEQIESVLTLERIITVLCSAFGLIATLLAGIGLYGVMAFHVGRRTREIGLRMALGARGGDVLRQVLTEGGSLVIAGIAIGVPAALALGEVTRTFLFGIQPNDVLTLAGTAVFLLLVALIATFVPAYRASRIDPLRALRYE
jgi:predicted permease